MLKVLRLIFTFMLVLTAAGVNAQVTTSAISGKVTDEQNETVICLLYTSDAADE